MAHRALPSFSEISTHQFDRKKMCAIVTGQFVFFCSKNQNLGDYLQNDFSDYLNFKLIVYDPDL